MPLWAPREAGRRIRARKNYGAPDPGPDAGGVRYFRHKRGGESPENHRYRDRSGAPRGPQFTILIEARYGPN